jgi:hypothetical protein
VQKIKKGEQEVNVTEHHPGSKTTGNSFIYPDFVIKD